MTLYDTALFLHVVAIALWLGAGVALMSFLQMASKAGSLDVAAAVVARDEKLGSTLFPAAGVVALLSGAWLVHDGPWGWGDPWISIGLTGIFAAILFGAIVHGRMGKRASALVEAGDLPAVQRHLARWARLSWIDVAIIVLVIADMVFKPGA